MLLLLKNPVIPDTEECRNIIKIIDKAEYVSERSFSGRTKEMGNLDSKCLSTGSKTLINIISHTDMCFDVCECGDPECDIYYDNKKITNVCDFAAYAVKKDS